MQISVLQTTATGTAVYVETQTPTTNANGLVSIEIGMGSVECFRPFYKTPIRRQVLRQVCRRFCIGAY